jgi:MFS family permease
MPDKWKCMTMVRLVLAARALRAFGDGYLAVLLPAYLIAIGHDQLAVGMFGTATLLGSAAATMVVGRCGNRFELRGLLMASAVVMVASGLGFASVTALWPLLLVGFIGPMNPGGSDVSIFLPLEHSILATAGGADVRTKVFAHYSFVGSMAGACGALAAILPDFLTGPGGLQVTEALRAMFVLYAAIGLLVWMLYAHLPRPPVEKARRQAPALGTSRGIVARLAGLFAVDAFAGGLIVNALLVLWLFERFGLSLTAAGTLLFWTGLLSAVSQLAAPALAARIGLVNTMVFTHIPSSLCLIGAALSPSLDLALALLLVRSLLSQMDVPARSAYVMSVVTAPERPAASSVISVARSFASALGPTIAGAWFASGDLATPLVVCGALKIGYDLALFAGFRRVPLQAEVEEP